ncbi:hypothetical protein RvY_01483 [Ramazzottius varieornatus]|uniref:Histidine-specific methyltransferase SAM-dependent domain-containing protein n=1 Tax=Ramazzottius varieornatus TaxID=947166 RepID=A0A1D1UGH5_RAMVA|nr:hypothetical protein RvY_01483 [Ramazzottius varieornatus]
MLMVASFSRRSRNHPNTNPTRTEIGINTVDIVAGMSSGSVLIESGSGSSLKTEILLAALDKMAVYFQQVRWPEPAICHAFSGRRVDLVVGDCRNPLRLPAELAALPPICFVPGFTIGIFRQDEAKKLLRSMGSILGADGRLIIGADLRKSMRTLLSAYDDAPSVTAAFNKNLLVRSSRELVPTLTSTLSVTKRALTRRGSRIEMYLVSKRAQVVRSSRLTATPPSNRARRSTRRDPLPTTHLN